MEAEKEQTDMLLFHHGFFFLNGKISEYGSRTGRYLTKNHIFTRKRLFARYMKELMKTSPDEFDEEWHDDFNETCMGFVDDYLFDDDYEWIDIIDEEKNKIIGFLIILPNADEKGRFFVDQCYVVPRQRRKHRMQSLMETVIKNRKPHMIEMFILPKNTNGVSFWFHFMETHGFSQRTDDENEDLFIFEKG